MTSDYSLNKPTSFNKEWYNLWNEKMKFFKEEIDCGIWKIVKEDSLVPTHDVKGVVVNKLEKD